MAKVSVLIPCYNAARFLAATIDSALAQRFRDFEIIVVDDCSTDDSAQIAAQRPVTVIRLGANSGQAAALNEGLQRATGQYVAFLDADDLWAPTKLDRCVSALDENGEAVLAYSNGVAIDAAGAQLWPLLPPGHEPPDAAGILLNCVIDCPAQVVARRSVLGPFTPGLQSNDHDQWIRMREKGPFRYVDEKLVYYRKHPGQISHSRKQWEDGFKILRDARRRHPYPRGVVRRRLAVLYFRLAEHDRQAGRRLRSTVEYALAGALDPLRAARYFLGAQSKA